MTESNNNFDLPATMNHDVCAQLFSDLGNWRGQSVTINAGEVKQFGVIAAQLLLVAKRTWAADGADIRIVGASEGFDQSMRRLGLNDAIAEEE